MCNSFFPLLCSKRFTKTDRESLYQYKALARFTALLGAQLFQPPRSTGYFARTLLPRYKPVADKYGWGCACKWKELLPTPANEKGQGGEKKENDEGDDGAPDGWEVDDDDEEGSSSSSSSSSLDAPIREAMFTRHLSTYKVHLRSLPPSAWMEGVDSVLINSLVEMIVSSIVGNEDVCNFFACLSGTA